MQHRIKRSPGFPANKSVDCVISVKNEKRTLQRQLDELIKLPFEQVIVVVNGSTDGSADIARQHPIRATVMQFDEALGYDVGRAVGASASNAEIVLFLDGDMCISAHSLVPFIQQAERGADVVLNPISSLLPVFANRDTVSHLKHFLNVSLGRSDLHADSMTAIPHVLSRHAIRTIGIPALCVPPLAQALAICAGLKVVSAPKAINVIKHNRKRPINTGKGNPVERLIIGDHLEALHALTENSPRLHFADTVRRHELIDRFLGEAASLPVPEQ
jgi:CTP:molybdopterin cytidylyltransferase MocA